MIQVRALHNSVITILLALNADLAQAGQDATLIADPAYAQAQQLVEVEPRRRLNLYCIGTGTPAVIFEAGLGDDMSVWGRVQPDVRKNTRACAYDRAGLGYSDPARRASTSANIVDDLHRLLHRAFIGPTYILVGHSYGGLNIVLYTDRYPSEVAGIVLVDPALENQVRQVRSFFHGYDKTFLQPLLETERVCVAAAMTGFVQGTKIYDDCVPKPDPALSDAINGAHLARYLLPATQRAALSEDQSLRSGRSGEQVRAARRSFNDMPMIILAIPPSPRPLVPGETQPMQDAIMSARRHELEVLARRSSKGVVRFVSDSGHYIQSERPSMVVDAVRDVLEQAR